MSVKFRRLFSGLIFCKKTIGISMIFLSTISWNLAGSSSRTYPQAGLIVAGNRKISAGSQCFPSSLKSVSFRHLQQYTREKLVKRCEKKTLENMLYGARGMSRKVCTLREKWQPKSTSVTCGHVLSHVTYHVLVLAVAAPYPRKDQHQITERRAGRKGRAELSNWNRSNVHGL